MLSFDINLVAVLVAAVLSMVLGATWYSPAVFGKKWMALVGMTAEKAKNGPINMGTAYFLGFIGSLVAAYVLALVVVAFSAGTFVQGLQVGFWIWLGFYATQTLGTVLWEQRPFNLYVLNNAYWLVMLLLMSGVLAVM